MSIERQAVDALKWTSVARLVGQVFTWGVTIFVVRLLAPEDYGLVALASSIATILLTIADFGLGLSVVQTPDLPRSQLSSVAGIVLLLNLAIGALLAALAPLFAFAFEESRLAPVVAVSALNFVLLAFGALPQALAQREMHFKLLASVELAGGVVASLVTLALAWLGAGVWALVLGSLSNAALRTGWLLIARGFVRPSFRFEGMRGHARFGGSLTASRLVWLVASQADVFIAGRLLGPQALGTYSVSLHLATLPMQKIMGIVNQVAFPAIARLQAEPERMRERLLEAVRLLTFTSIPAAWGLSAVAPELVALALGPKWSEAVVPLQIICLIVPLRIFAATIVTSVAALGSAGTDLRNTIATAVLYPPAFFLGAQWGIVGLACAWVVASPVVLSFNFPRMSRVLGLSFGAFVGRVYGELLAGATMYAALALLRVALPPAGAAWQLAILVAAGAAVYLAIVSLVDRTVWSDVGRVARAARS